MDTNQEAALIIEEDYEAFKDLVKEKKAALEKLSEEDKKALLELCEDLSEED